MTENMFQTINYHSRAIFPFDRETLEPLEQKLKYTEYRFNFLHIDNKEMRNENVYGQMKSFLIFQLLIFYEPKLE